MARPGILVDSNIILDLFTRDPEWTPWSKATLQTYSKTHQLAINVIVYSELSLGFDRVEALDAALVKIGVRLRPLPKEALFLAARAFKSYRRRGGTRTSTLPDFFIGAHAAAEGLPLITRDAKRYQTSYPKLRLISPP